MARDESAHVKNHPISALQQKAGGTETFTHRPRGISKMALATRAEFGANADKLLVKIYQRIPGRSETDTEDDYFDDELIAERSLGGLTSGATVRFFGAGQDVKIIGMFYNVAAEYVFTYEWDTRGSANSNVLAMISWTQSGGGL